MFCYYKSLTLFITCLCYFSMLCGQASIEKGSPFIIDLWENGLPNTNGMEQNGYDDKKKNYKPSIRVYLPTSTKPTKAVVICPGGGYSHLAMSHEGYNWGDYFNAQGVVAIVLKYRTPNGNLEVPVSDALEAIRIAQENAIEWNIDPDMIGIMGSSAGGHLASTIANHAPDDRRPAFQILFYPVISMDSLITHSGSRKRFLGEDPTKELEEKYSNERQINAKTPRAFIALADDDKVVRPINALNYHAALQDSGIPSSLYRYPDGNHGWGIKLSFKHHAAMLMDLQNWLSSF